MRMRKLVGWWLAVAFAVGLGAVSCGDDGGGEAASGPRLRAPSAIPSVAIDCGGVECIR